MAHDGRIAGAKGAVLLMSGDLESQAVLHVCCGLAVSLSVDKLGCMSHVLLGVCLLPCNMLHVRVVCGLHLPISVSGSRCVLLALQYASCTGGVRFAFTYICFWLQIARCQVQMNRKLEGNHAHFQENHQRTKVSLASCS